MKREENSGKELTMEEFLDEVLPNRVGMSIGFNIESIDGYGMIISMKQARVFCEEGVNGFGLNYGQTEIFIYEDMIESITRYDKNLYNIEFTANIPDIELNPSVVF